MASTSSATFERLLRRPRLAAGPSQEALAERAGVSTRGVQDLERGLRIAPRAETIRLLADALGVSGEPWAALFAAAHPELASSLASAVPPPRLLAPPIPPTPLVGREQEVGLDGEARPEASRGGGASTLSVSLPDAAQAGVIRKRLGQVIAEIPAQAQPAGCDLHELKFRAESLAGQDQLQLEEDDRIDRRPSRLGRRIADQLSYDIEVECALQMSVEVIRGDEVFRGDGR